MAVEDCCWPGLRLKEVASDSDMEIHTSNPCLEQVIMMMTITTPLPCSIVGARGTGFVSELTFFYSFEN